MKTVCPTAMKILGSSHGPDKDRAMEVIFHVMVDATRWICCRNCSESKRFIKNLYNTVARTYPITCPETCCAGH